MLRIRVTIAEFDALPETTQPTELIDGEIIVSPSPIPLHQISVGNTYNYVRDLKPNGMVLLSPMDVYLDDLNVVQPDVFWVAYQSRCVMTRKRFEGPPDLVVEVLFPTTVARDRGDKFDLYERFGVYEYWMTDPDARFVEVYTHNGQHFVRQGVFTAGQTFASKILGGVDVEVAKLMS
jgi:Uma2 family endonuclease